MTSDICIYIYANNNSDLSLIDKIKNKLDCLTIVSSNIKYNSDINVIATTPEKSLLYCHFISTLMSHLKILYIHLEDFNCFELIDIEHSKLLDHFDLVVSNYIETNETWPKKAIINNSFWIRADYMKTLDVSLLESSRNDYIDFVLRNEPCIVSINDQLLQLKNVIEKLSFTDIIMNNNIINKYVSIGNYVYIPIGDESRRILSPSNEIKSLVVTIDKFIITNNKRFKARIIPKNYVKTQFNNDFCFFINSENIKEIDKEVKSKNLTSFYTSYFSFNEIEMKDINIIQYNCEYQYIDFINILKLCSKLSSKKVYYHDCKLLFNIDKLQCFSSQ